MTNSPSDIPRLSEGTSSVPGRPLRVLVVDDDKDTVLSLMLLLRSEGHEAKGAGSAAEMWALMDEFDPDAVLLDITLPDRNGYDLARELRRRYGDKRPALIAVTAWNKGSDRVLAELAGFNHHVGKPYDPAALLRLLAPLKPASPADLFLKCFDPAAPLNAQSSTATEANTMRRGTGAGEVASEGNARERRALPRGVGPTLARTKILRDKKTPTEPWVRRWKPNQSPDARSARIFITARIAVPFSLAGVTPAA